MKNARISNIPLTSVDAAPLKGNLKKIWFWHEHRILDKKTRNVIFLGVFQANQVQPRAYLNSNESMNARS